MMDGGDAPSAKFTLKESISRTFGTGFLDGSITAVSAEKATMAPPGAPPPMGRTLTLAQTPAPTPTPALTLPSPEPNLNLNPNPSQARRRWVCP